MTTETHHINVSGIKVEVLRKDIKNLLQAMITVTSEGFGGFAHTDLNMTDLHTSSGGCAFDDTGSCTAIALFDPSLGLLLTESFEVSAGCRLLLNGICSSDANYLNTSFISLVSFADLDGNPLNLTFTSDSGLPYPMTQPTNGVPEPATLALLTLGLAGLGFSRRKQ